MTTLEELAGELGAQPFEVMAFMGWDSPTTRPDGFDPENISDEDAAEARDVFYATPDLREAAEVDLTPTDIAAIRTLMGLSQRQLAELIGVNQTTVRGWELGHFDPNRESVRAFLALKQEHDQLVSDTLVDTTRGVPVTLNVTERFPRSWFLAVAARVMDRAPTMAPVTVPQLSKERKIATARRIAKAVQEENAFGLR